ncbi:MAG: TolC family protein [Lentisphaerae bacterium]|nr:TolC family protein [Lentisphaerota bacterium]
MTVDTCIQSALDANPGLAAAAHRLEASEAAIQQARAAYFPMLKTAGTYARTDNPPQAFMMALNQRAFSMDRDFNNPEDTENLRLSLEARYRLFDGGRRSLDSEAAGLSAAATAEAVRTAQNELIHQVTRAYYGALQAQAMTQVQADTLHSLEENLRVANERLKAGSVVRTDVLNLEVKLAEAREDLMRASNGVLLAVAALNTAIGAELVTADRLAGPAGAAPPPPEADLDAASERPEIKGTRLAAEAYQRSWQRTRRDYLPNFSAFGSLDWDSDVSTEFENSYMVGVVADWDIFTGFQRQGASRQAGAQWRVARSVAEEARNQLQLDLTTAYLQASEAWGRIGVAQKGVVSAAEAQRMTRERYEQGAADITELLTAEVGLSAMRTRDVAAQYDYRIALSNVARARGDLVSKWVVDD